jgi:cation-transporting ATPase 13A3/4/5
VLVALLLFVATFKNDFSFFVAADFGDAVDPTFNCPAYTTCKQVCVAAVEDCPAEMQCPANETLCVDGSCATECDDPSAESPCAFDCASVACNKVDNYYDACNTLYGPWYTNETKCGETEKEETQFAWNMTEPGFVLMYVWIILLTLSIVSWCAYNQRIAPVSGAVQSLNVQNKPNEPEHAVAAWQTGYRVNVVGIFLQLWTVLTLISMHALLGWLTIQYYVNEEVFTSIPLRFEDQENLLKFFEILWMVSFVFSFMLKWPYSLKSLFLRRCELANATHVAICVYQSADDGQETFHTGYMAFLRVLLTQVQSALDKIMTVIFSDVDAYGRKKGANGIYQFCKVERDSEGSRFFVFGFRRYNLDAETGHYQPGVYTIGKSVGDMQSAGAVEGGLSNAEVESRRRVVGPNAIEMPPPNAFKIIFKEFGQPFYTYQAFMVWTWFPLWYYYMALTWTFVILIGGLTVSYFQYRNDRNLYKITHITGEISVLRDGEMVQLSPKELVPGDIVEVRPGTTYCDMVVLSTSSIMIDESALTGEATPKLKASIREAESSAADYSSEKHKRHTIWAGTLVLETDNTRAMVTQTASYTARGELIRDIYSYKRHQFKFDVEVPIVIAILFFYAIFGFSMVAYFIQDSPVYAWFYGMFVVATILPPLLPTVFTVSVGISSDRLARKQISCTNPEAILVAGKVDRALFDKTGTLTKQGLDFMDAKAHGRLDSELSLAMASCHTLSVTQTGILAGHPVDREMFEQSGAISNSTSGPLVNITDKLGQAATIVRHFDFDHHRMTQSVIVKKASDQSIVVFVKGSGENIKKICEKSSIPEEFDKALRQTAKAGVYQIAVAMKTLDPATDVSQITRDEVENSLTFVGHVDFKNVIRPETSEVIQHLHSGRVKTVMVTGDSVLTGVCIAKEAGIFTEGAQVIVGHSSDSDAVQWTDSNDHLCSLPSHDSLTDSRIELALSAQAWSTLRTSDPKQAAQLFEFIRVYGRCTPYDKISIVTAFNERGQVTLMCGDGGTCGGRHVRLIEYIIAHNFSPPLRQETIVEHSSQPM